MKPAASVIRWLKVQTLLNGHEMKLAAHLSAASDSAGNGLGKAQCRKHAGRLIQKEFDDTIPDLLGILSVRCEVECEAKPLDSGDRVAQVNVVRV
jgi:hypothetical protein